MVNPEIILEIKNIIKTYDQLTAVDNISFNIIKGEIFGLLGPNGAGKTTIIKSILNEISINSGLILFSGLDIKTDLIHFKQKIGYLPEESFVYDSMTPEKLFNFISSIREDKNLENTTKRLKEYLHSLDLLQYYHQYFHTLSKGTKRKFEIIAAFLHNPQLVIMDEPFNGIDPSSMIIIKQIIKLNLERGCSILFSTHNLEQAEHLCSRFCILNEGKIHFIGSMKEINELNNNISLEQFYIKIITQEKILEEKILNLQNVIN